MTDPFNQPAAPADDPFVVATSSFIEPDDIDGRTILYIPTGTGTAKGTQGPYEYVTGDMLVLSGPLTDKIPGPLPFEVVGQRISCGIINQVKPHVRTQKMVIGLVHSQPSSVNKQVKAYRLVEPTAEQVAAARPMAAAWIEQRRAAQAANDPFATV